MLIFILVGFLTPPIELDENITLLAVTASVLGLVSTALVLFVVLLGFFKGRWRYHLLFGGALTGIAAWVGFVLISDEPSGTLICSAHFIVASTLLLVHLRKKSLRPQLTFINFQHSQKCLLRDLDAADLFHSFFAFFLLFEELAFARCRRRSIWR